MSASTKLRSRKLPAMASSEKEHGPEKPPIVDMQYVRDLARAGRLSMVIDGS